MWVLHVNIGNGDRKEKRFSLADEAEILSERSICLYLVK